MTGRHQNTNTRLETMSLVSSLSCFSPVENNSRSSLSKKKVLLFFSEILHTVLLYPVQTKALILPLCVSMSQRWQSIIVVAASENTNNNNKEDF